MVINCRFKYVGVQDRALKLYPALVVHQGVDNFGFFLNFVNLCNFTESGWSLLSLELTGYRLYERIKFVLVAINVRYFIKFYFQ